MKLLLLLACSCVAKVGECLDETLAFQLSLWKVTSGFQ